MTVTGGAVGGGEDRGEGYSWLSAQFRRPFTPNSLVHWPRFLQVLLLKQISMSKIFFGVKTINVTVPTACGDYSVTWREWCEKQTDGRKRALVDVNGHHGIVMKRNYRRCTLVRHSTTPSLFPKLDIGGLHFFTGSKCQDLDFRHEIH